MIETIVSYFLVLQATLKKAIDSSTVPVFAHSLLLRMRFMHYNILLSHFGYDLENAAERSQTAGLVQLASFFSLFFLMDILQSFRLSEIFPFPYGQLGIWRLWAQSIAQVNFLSLRLKRAGLFATFPHLQPILTSQFLGKGEEEEKTSQATWVGKVAISF